MKRAFPRLKDGDELTPRHLNLIYAELERWNKASASGGIVFNNREGGPHWHSLAGGFGLRVGTLPSGGIAAEDTGTVTLLDGTELDDVYNPWDTDTATTDTTKCLVGAVDGRLSVILWDCS